MGDHAIIALRSWDILAGHGPLVGQFTQAKAVNGHHVFSPGPLLYWGLAIPTHLMPRMGPVLGIELISASCLILACMAAAHTAGRLTAVVVGGGAVVGMWSMAAELGGSPIWDPYAPLVAFSAALILAWAIGAGRLGWWPVLVILASFCTQGHLMYATSSVVLCLVSPLLGMAAARRRGHRIAWKPLAVGVVVGIVCWMAPLWQQLHGHPGNLWLLWKATVGSSAPTLGTGSALRFLGAAVNPLHPAWLHAPRDGRLADTGSSLWTLVVLVALSTTAFVGWVEHESEVTAAAVVALVADLGAVITLSHLQTSSLVSLAYIKYDLWPASLMTCFALGYAVVKLAWPRVRKRWPTGLSVFGDPRTAAVGLAGLVIVALLTTGVYRNAPSYAHLRGAAQGNVTVKTAADRIVRLIGRPGSPKRLAVTEPSGKLPFLEGWDIMENVVYQLRVGGWNVSIADPLLRLQLEASYRARRTDQRVTFTSGIAPAGGRLLGTVELPNTDGPSPQSIWLTPGRAG